MDAIHNALGTLFFTICVAGAGWLVGSFLPIQAVYKGLTGGGWPWSK